MVVLVSGDIIHLIGGDVKEPPVRAAVIINCSSLLKNIRVHEVKQGLG